MSDVKKGIDLCVLVRVLPVPDAISVEDAYRAFVRCEPHLHMERVPSLRQRLFILREGDMAVIGDIPLGAPVGLVGNAPRSEVYRYQRGSAPDDRIRLIHGTQGTCS